MAADEVSTTRRGVSREVLRLPGVPPLVRVAGPVVAVAPAEGVGVDQGFGLLGWHRDPRRHVLVDGTPVLLPRAPEAAVDLLPGSHVVVAGRIRRGVLEPLAWAGEAGARERASGPAVLPLLATAVLTGGVAGVVRVRDVLPWPLDLTVAAVGAVAAGLALLVWWVLAPASWAAALRDGGVTGEALVVRRGLAVEPQVCRDERDAAEYVWRLDDGSPEGPTHLRLLEPTGAVHPLADGAEVVVVLAAGAPGGGRVLGLAAPEGGWLVVGGVGGAGRAGVGAGGAVGAVACLALLAGAVLLARPGVTGAVAAAVLAPGWVLAVGTLASLAARVRLVRAVRALLSGPESRYT